MKNLIDYVEDIVEMLGKFELRCAWTTQNNTIRQCLNERPDITVNLPCTEATLRVWVRRRPVFRPMEDGRFKKDDAKGASDDPA